MADHLRLTQAVALPTKRLSTRYDPDAEPFDRGRHATTLRGLLEGLESANPKLFEPPVLDDQAADEELDASGMGTIVLKFTGTAAFSAGAFSAWEMVPVAANDHKQYFVLSDATSRRAFREFADGYVEDPDAHINVAAWRAVLENIAGIELYDRADRLPEGLEPPTDGQTADIDIALWPTSIATRGAEAEGQRRVAEVVSLIDTFVDEDPRVSVLAFDDAHPDTLLIHARLNEPAFEAVVDHPFVERVRGPVAIEVRLHDLVNGSSPASALLPEGAPIGIIDDLVVTDNPWLESVVVEQREFPASHAFGDYTPHGTQVAGIAAWGNILQLLSDGFDGQPHPLFVARVAQMNDRYEAQIVGNAAGQIVDAMNWLADSGVKIVVLALGENHPDDGAIPSDLASVVDRVARERDLVVVTSAGNLVAIDGHWKNDYPGYLRDASAKIAAPGSAALALTVGSVAHSSAFDRERWPNGVGIANRGDPAPYTRTGPSRGNNAAGRQKPEFAAHGGSWAFDQATGNLILDDANLAATTLIPPVNGRLFASTTGTSFAAPRIAHEVARIQSRYPGSGANLLRALTALAGDRPPPGMPRDDDVLAGLYGIPDADRVLESGGNRVIFVFEGSMPTNSHSVIELPIPAEFAAGASERELRVALAFDPPVRRSRRDYIAGRMRFEFIQRESMEDIRNSFARQPTVPERAANPSLSSFNALAGRDMDPPKTRLSADTLVCRTYHSTSGGWDEDDRDYHLVITHDFSPWSQAQQAAYASQSFALAVSVVDIGRVDLDLYALAQARLQARSRARGGDE